MSILKKTRADLSVALFFRIPCLNLTDIAFALMLYDNYGHSERFFDVLDSHRRDFDSFEVVKEIVREHINGTERDAARKPAEKTTAQEVKAYVENEKVFERFKAAGETPEGIRKVRQVQKVFRGKFIT